MGIFGIGIHHPAVARGHAGTEHRVVEGDIVKRSSDGLFGDDRREAALGVVEAVLDDRIDQIVVEREGRGREATILAQSCSQKTELRFVKGKYAAALAGHVLKALGHPRPKVEVERPSARCVRLERLAYVMPDHQA